MKNKYLLIFTILVVAIILSGCAGGGITPGINELTTEEKALISLWGYNSLRTVRWPDGYVDVYDSTGYNQMQQILNQWNSTISGAVTFRLSNNPNSPVRIYSRVLYDEHDYLWEGNATWNNSNYALSKVIIRIDKNSINDYPVRLHSFRAVVGFNRRIGPSEVCSNEDNISNIMRKMVKALYKVPPGYPLY